MRRRERKKLQSRARWQSNDYCLLLRNTQQHHLMYLFLSPISSSKLKGFSLRFTSYILQRALFRNPFLIPRLLVRFFFDLFKICCFFCCYALKFLMFQWRTFVASLQTLNLETLKLVSKLFIYFPLCITNLMTFYFRQRLSPC